MKSQIRNMYSQTSSSYAFKPIFDSSLSFLPWDQYNSLVVWKVDSVAFWWNKLLLTKLKLLHQKKSESHQKDLEKRRLIYNHRLRLRDEFLLTHCWGEMFDLQHYFQSGGRVLYVSLEEKGKINGENVSHDSFLRLNRSAAIFPNNYEQSNILDCTSSPANHRCISKQWKAPCGNWLSSFSSLTIFKK